MNDAEYQATQGALLSLAGMIAQLNLPAFLARIETAHAAGPILDPTMYRDALDNLRSIERIARAALPLREAVLEEQGRAAKQETQAMRSRQKGRRA